MPDPRSFDGLTVRPERAADFDAIDEVVRTAFASDAEVRLVRAIRASGGYIPQLALVAEFDGVVVGHVMISRATLRRDDGDQPIVILAPVAVRPADQGGGIGGELVRTAVAAAERVGEPLVVLEGSPGYYSRLGFEPASIYGIGMPVPDWAPPEAAQVYRLSRFDDAMQGEVVYAEAFDVVE